MGMDICMHIVKNGRFIKEDIFNGRNSDWFMKLQGKSIRDEYAKMPIKIGVSKQTPNYNENFIADKKEEGCFDFFYISVKDFETWFEKYRPDIDAGWVSTYDKWRMERKGYCPDELPHWLDAEDNIADMHFVEYNDPYDCSGWLYSYLVDNNIDEDADITYWFDW